MTRRCEVTGKTAQVGNHVSHANNKTKRRFEINLQNIGVFSESLKRFVTLRATPSGLRTVEHKGGLDAWLLSVAPTKLTTKLRKLREQVVNATKAS